MSLEEPPLVTLDQLTVGYGERTVLEDLSFQIPRRGIWGLLGPAGVGKSTLLRTLSRWNDALPTFWHRGRVGFEGHDLHRDFEVEEIRRQLALLRQKSRLYAASVAENILAEVRSPRTLERSERRRRAREVLDPLGLWPEYEPHLDAPAVSLPIGAQRRLAVARLAAGAPHALLLDEPFRDLDPVEQRKVERLLARIAGSMAVVLCSHDQRRIRRVSDRVALLSAGRLVEEAPTERFFTAPRTELAREFLRTGNCWPKPPEDFGEEAGEGERGEGVDPAIDPAPAAAVRVRFPSELHWVLPGLLGGCQQPGLLADAEQELAGLCRLGCRVLVSLREQPPDAEAVRRHGMESLHVPIPDMGAPTPQAALDLCARISAWVDAGRPTVLHCKAGLGRTGMILAAVLHYRGMAALAAVEKVRSVNPRYIQSEAQLELILGLEELTDSRAPRAPQPSTASSNPAISSSTRRS